jgi:hypothetical protein
MERLRRPGGEPHGHAAVPQTSIGPGKRTLTEAVQPAPASAAASAGASAETPDDVRAAAASGIDGPGEALPYLPAIQASFGPQHDVSGIVAHVGGPAAAASTAIGASAYATGNHVAFGASPDLHTAAHEAAHVVQQRSGVQLFGGVGQSGDVYERHADAVAERVVAGASAADLLAAGPQGTGTGAAVQCHDAWAAVQCNDAAAGAAQGTGTETENALVSTEEVAASAAVQSKTLATPVQARGQGQPVQRQNKTKEKRTLVPHKIHVPRPMTVDEYKIHAMTQVFGGVITGVTWEHMGDSYTPDKSPYTLHVDMVLLRRHRGSVNKAKGIDVGEDGGVTGAAERGKKFENAPDGADKKALMDEIDRRYYAASGNAEGTKIKPGEKGNAQLWFQIRDEVLFQHDYFAKLPPKVKELIKFSIHGRELTPADYDKLFEIAKKIERMPPGQVADYASKVTGSTTDLDAFDAALDKYITEHATREHQASERDKVKTQLLGLEEVYKKYRSYKSALTTEAMGASMGMSVPGAPVMLPGTPTASGMYRKELEELLKPHGFASISEFEAFIKKFEKAFELEAVNITKDLMAKYAGRLYREAERYKDPKELSALHQKLGGVRTNYKEFEKNAKISNNYNRDSEMSRLPGNGHLRPKIGPAEAKAAYDKAAAAKAAAQADVQGLAGAHPIFQEDHLPLDRRIDKASLASADESQLGSLIQSHLAARQKDVAEARDRLDDKPELIYKLDKLLPQFYLQQNIASGSIYDMIIQDKIKDDAIMKLIGGIVLAVVAIALAIVSFGTATPAIAAGAAAMGFGLSAYMAYDEYQHYAEEKDMADVGFAKDPSVVWLVVAVAGAALDMGAAVKAMKALGPAAKTLEAGGDAAEFAKLVKALEAKGEIDAKIARAAEQAAAARKGFVEASGELASAMGGKLYSFPGPLTDPDVYRALVKMAKEGFGVVWHESVQFLEHIRKLRIDKGLKDLSPEEIVKVREAWEQARVIKESANAPVDIIGTSGRTIGKYSNGSFLEIIPSNKKDVLHGGNTIALDPNKTTTVTGTLGDTNKVAVRGEQLPGATLMGENVGGVNILRSPEWQAIQTKHKAILDAGDELKYWKTVTDEFWENVNKPWIDQAIARGDKFRFVSDPTSEAAIYVTNKGGFVTENGNKIKSIFGREVDYLKSKGYEFLSDGTAVRK